MNFEIIYFTVSRLYQSRGKDTTKSKKLEYNIIFVHDLWKSLLIQAMIAAATLLINMGDFPTLVPFIAVIELVIQLSNDAFMQLYCHPCHPEVFIFGNQIWWWSFSFTISPK